MIKVSSLLQGFNPSPWVSGLCAEFAIALSETLGEGYFYIIRGFYEDDGEESYENGHVVFSQDGGVTGLDAYGKHPMESIKEASGWSSHLDITHIEAEVLSRKELDWEMNPYQEQVDEARVIVSKLISAGYFK